MGHNNRGYPHPVPIIGGPQMSEEDRIIQAYRGLYLSLVQIASAQALSGHDLFKIDDPNYSLAQEEQIPLMAERIALSAMSRLGVTITPGRPTEQQ